MDFSNLRKAISGISKEQINEGGNHDSVMTVGTIKSNGFGGFVNESVTYHSDGRIEERVSQF